MERDDWEKVLNIRPLTDLPKKALGYDVPFITPVSYTHLMMSSRRTA